KVADGLADGGEKTPSSLADGGRCCEGEKGESPWWPMVAVVADGAFDGEEKSSLREKKRRLES
ncbi:hypothetical protein Dimus_036783, partial [Dionaea muscipula]